MAARRGRLGALLSAALILTVSWRTVPAYDAPDIIYLAAWSPLIIAGAPVYSVDGRLAGEAWRRLGPRVRAVGAAAPRAAPRHRRRHRGRRPDPADRLDARRRRTLHRQVHRAGPRRGPDATTSPAPRSPRSPPSAAAPDPGTDGTPSPSASRLRAAPSAGRSPTPLRGTAREAGARARRERPSQTPGHRPGSRPAAEPAAEPPRSDTGPHARAAAPAAVRRRQAADAAAPAAGSGGGANGPAAALIGGLLGERGAGRRPAWRGSRSVRWPPVAYADHVAAVEAGQRGCARKLLGGLGEVLRGVDRPPVRALRQREAGQPPLAGQPRERRALVVAAVRQQRRESAEKTYTPALIRYGEGGDSMKSGTWPNSSVSTAPQGMRGRASASVATASRSAWKAAISRSEKRVQMSPLVAYQGSVGVGEPAAAYFRPPPRPSGSFSTTVVTRSGRSAESSHSWRTSARWPQETTASVTPSAASQAS